MTTVALSDTEAGRQYQLWAYSPSHQRLMLRSPARGDDDANVDITFTGVEVVREIPTTLRIDSIDVVDDPTGTTQTFVLRSGDRQSLVRAVSVRIERNNKPLFEGLDDPASRTFEIAKTVELAVLQSLQAMDPSWIVLRRDEGPDFEIVSPHGKLFVEVIWTHSGPVDKVVRRLVIDRVSRWKSEELRNSPLVVVMSGIQADLVAAEIPPHLLTGTGSRPVMAMVWDAASGPQRLRTAISELWLAS